MSDPSPSGETWVCTAANALTSPCTERRPHDFGGSTCGPVPSSDTPSDERACERPGCGHPMDDHDGEHGCEDCVMCPAYVPPIGSRLHGQWAGSNEDPVRWCALCGTWEDEADWITHSGHASLFPTDDVRHADAVTAEPEWSTRPVPSSDTPSDERDEVCGSMGPRIGDEPEQPRCAQPLDHDGQHRGFPGSGFESVQWGGPIMRDGDFARTYRPDPPPTPVDGPERCHVGIDDGRLVQRLRAETISRAEHLVGPWTVDLIALAADRIEALAGGGGWSPKFETFEQYHAWVAASPTPVDGDSGRQPWPPSETPNSDRYLPLELFVAGAISTLPPFNQHHPAYALPHARHAIEAIPEFEPDDADRPSPVGEERRPVDVTALPEWAAFVKRHQHEPTTEDLCAQSGHAYAGDDAGGGRCYCGQTEYPLGGSSRADRRDRA